MPKTLLKEIRSTTSKKSDTDSITSPHNFSGRDSEGSSPYSSQINDIKNAKHSLAIAHFAPDAEGIQRAIYERYPELNPKGEFMARKKTKSQRKVQTVMKEFQKGELNIGKSDKRVKSRKQAVAIALSEAGLSKKKLKKKKKK